MRRKQQPELSRIILYVVVASGIIGVGLTIFIASFIILQIANFGISQGTRNFCFAAANTLEPIFDPKGEETAALAEAKTALDRYFINLPNFEYTLFAADGIPLISNHPFEPLKATPNTAPEVFQALERHSASAIRADESKRRMVFSAVVIDPHDPNSPILQISVPQSITLHPARVWVLILILIGALIIAGMGLAAWKTGRSITRSLEQVHQVAVELSNGNLAARAQPEGPIEVAKLAETLNIMSGRVQNSQETMSAFVANASHEMRTPLTAIKLQVEALQDGAADDPVTARQFLGRIDRELNRLIHMVNDLLDLSRIESGARQAPFQTIAILPFVEEVLAFWSARAARAGVDLRLNAQAEAAEIEGDEMQLHRLLDNLLDNSIKNTPSGGWIEIAILHEDAWIRLEIMDNGRGIPPELIPHVFDRFYRIDPRAKDDQGSGLGLSLAHSIVQAHHGQIGIASNAGAGVTVWVRLPPSSRRASAL